MLFLFSACKPSGEFSDISWEIEDGVLTVDGNGSIGDFCTDMYGVHRGTCYDSSTIPWYGLDYHTLILGDGITYVSDHAFVDSASLQKVIIQAEKVEIRRGAFRNCINLQEIENSEQIVSIGEGAFENCTSLKSVKLGAQFYFALSTASVAENEMEHCFSGCSSLERIEIDKDNAWFASCDGVVYTKNMDVLIYYPVGKQDKAFVIPETVEKICAYAFTMVEYLEEITLTGCDVAENTFYACPVLNTVVVGDDITICPSYFKKCFALERFRVRDDHPKYSVIDGVLYHSAGDAADGKLTLSCYPAGKKDRSFTVPKEVTQIQQSAFYGSCYLEHIDFAGEGISVIGTAAFRACTSLKTVTLPESVTTIGESAFLDCTSLKSVTLPERVTTIGERAFGYCTSLESITIPESVTSLGQWALMYCKSLKSIRIPGSISTIDQNSFCGCAELRTVEISEGVNKITLDVFRECESLETVAIPQSVTEISNFAFDANRSHLTILCPKGTAAEEYAKSNGISYTIQET